MRSEGADTSSGSAPPITFILSINLISMINMMNDIVKYISLLIISLLFPLLTIACKDAADGVQIPDNWIVISTDKIEFAYEGGQDVRNFQLVTGIDESELQVSLSNGEDDWLTVTTQNGRITGPL